MHVNAREAHIETDDRQLIQRMASRDAHALEAFYERYNRVVFTMILRIVGVRQDAEDVLSDVFWQAWQQASRYDTSAESRSRGCCIARTRAIDSLRSGAKRGAETEFDGNALRRDLNGSRSLVLAGLQHAVKACLEKLAEPNASHWRWLTLTA